VLTMVLGGLCAVVEKDFKKIVAMSTLSQLGMILFIISLGVWKLCFLHMIIHAFFKSMLFFGYWFYDGTSRGSARFPVLWGGSFYVFFLCIFFG